MADGFTIKSGIRQLRKDIKRVADTRIEAELVKANKDNAELVERAAKKRAPHLTGALEAGIKGRGTKTGAKVRSGSTGKSKRYASYQHWDEGRYGHLPSIRYLWEAGDDKKDETRDEYVKMIRRLARMLAKSYPATEEL